MDMQQLVSHRPGRERYDSPLGAVPFRHRPLPGHPGAGETHYDVLRRPYTPAEVRRLMRQTGGLIAGVIAVGLEDVIRRREDEFYALLGEQLVGEAEALNDITWQVIGADGGRLLLRVTADASGWLAGLAPAAIAQRIWACY
jgi:hypothetical protein